MDSTNRCIPDRGICPTRYPITDFNKLLTWFFWIWIQCIVKRPLTGYNKSSLNDKLQLVVNKPTILCLMWNTMPKHVLLLFHMQKILIEHAEKYQAIWEKAYKSEIVISISHEKAGQMKCVSSPPLGQGWCDQHVIRCQKCGSHNLSEKRSCEYAMLRSDDSTVWIIVLLELRGGEVVLEWEVGLMARGIYIGQGRSGERSLERVLENGL